MRKVPNVNTHIFKQPRLPWLEDIFRDYPHPLATGEEDLLSAMIQSQIASGNWDLMDSLAFMNLADATNSLWDVKRGVIMTAVGDPTHTAGVGYVLNGTTQHLNSNYNGNIDAVNFALNDGLVGAFMKSYNTAVGSHSLFGVDDRVANGGLISMSDVSASSRTDFQCSWASTFKPGTTDSFGANKNLITTNDAAGVNKLYLDGSLIQTNSDMVTSSLLFNRNIYIGATNSEGAAMSFMNGEISSFIVGSAIGFNHSDYDDELAILNTGLASL